MQEISKSQRDQMMGEILDRMDKHKNVERPTHQDFLQAIQCDATQSRTLDFLEAKGFISCIKNATSNNLLRIHVEKSGTTYFEDNAEISRNKRIENIKYFITTAIAIVALFKAFMPEICAALERLLQVS